MRLLFTTAPLHGHFYPLAQVAWAARAGGHEVLVAVPDDFVATVLAAGLPVASCGPAVDLAGRLAAPDAPPHGSAERRYATGRALGRVAASSLPGMTAVVTHWAPDLVVSERTEFAGPLAAAAAGVAHVEYRWGVAPLVEYRAGAVAELAHAGAGEPPDPVEVFSPWPATLRPAHPAARSIRDVAYNGAAFLPGWLLRPRTRPRICVTLGTLVPRLGGATGPDVAGWVRGLAGLDVEVLVAADEGTAPAWGPLPDGVRVGRLPLGQVLPACDVLVNHGGQGTVLAALGAGCPQLCLPQFDDQFDNARAVTRAGAGLTLQTGEATPEAVTELGRRLLHDSRHVRDARRIAAEIATHPSPVEVSDELVKLAAPGVGAMRSGPLPKRG
ncbi:nucleotide disphospho-sugar-binding domain-containing protein [Salinispora pacifica]|uniref:nucleotide disphospho-sugar-binding domain-containing protein n=1 Tax=Salinispora pacifica TaxID=351187 RepID=UPI0004B6255C|nr:nucleotide disphospho-sugar-binding domain-containing protein [Salinispora pacifica]